MDLGHTEKPSLAGSFLINSFCGCMGGIAQVLSGQPFDIVKVRLQNQSHTNPAYKSAMDWTRSIIRNEGYGAFYKGTMAPLTGIALCTSIQFTLNELSKRTMLKINEKEGAADPKKLSLYEYIVCGGIAGFGNSFVSTPVEHIRIRMQNQSAERDPKMRFTGSYDAISKIYRQFGLKSVYKGFGITMLRDIISFAVFFGTYEQLKSNGEKGGKKNSMTKLMTMGAFAGVLLWLATYPIDVWKTKLQLDSITKPEYKNSLDTAYQTFKREGVRGFGKGIGPCLIRAAISSAATIGVFEYTLNLVSPSNDKLAAV